MRPADSPAKGFNVDGGHGLRRGPDRSKLEAFFGADGLRGVVG
jgi:7-alpha-hydroxysteroid dehydrogenase